MVDTAKIKALCVKLGFGDLSDEEMERVIARLSKPQPMQMPIEKIDLDAAIEHVGCGPFSMTPSLTSLTSFTIGGTVEPGYEDVKAAFALNFEKGLERNSQLCIYHDGKPVVDLWGENTEADYSTAPPEGYDGDTLQIVYSSTKAMAATVFALAADRGHLSYDDPVSKHWSEFAQNGKEAITVADVLRHDAGLQAFDEPLTLDDTANQGDTDGEMSRIIAAQRPWAWRGGPDEGLTPRIYHAISRGFILNQILIRADPAGRTIGQWMAEELCGPLAADFYCGTASSDEWLSARKRAEMKQPSPNFIFANATVPAAISREVSDRYPNPPETQAVLEFMRGENYKFHPNVDNQTGGPSAVGFDPSLPEIEAPSASGRASARGMARVMSMLAQGGELDGVRVLSEAGRDNAILNPVNSSTRNHEGEMEQGSVVTGTAFVQGGWDAGPNRPVPGSIGWGGAGGSSIWFHPERGVGFGYTVTGFAAGLNGDQNRLEPIIQALQQTPAFTSPRGIMAATKTSARIAAAKL